MKPLKVLVLALCFFLAACTDLTVETPSPAPTITPIPTEIIPTETATPTIRVVPTATPGISPEAAAYLNEAWDIIEKNAYNKNKIDWPTFRARLLDRASAAKKPSDTYPFIAATLLELKDNHSFFMEPKKVSEQYGNSIPTPVPPDIKLLEGKLGYVLVPGYAGSNPDIDNQFATDMQKQIRAIDSQHPCGWIVDLRGNTGGNMWPMLVGIGPILGEGKAGSWVDAEGNHTEWIYQDGQGLIDTTVMTEVIGKPYRLGKTDPPVAVLFGRQTFSSGEIIAISFIGRPNTRSFGSESGGLTTANADFDLSDGAMIILTVGVDIDRNGKVYGGPIIPDVQVRGITSSAGPIPSEALEWLSTRPECTGK